MSTLRVYRLSLPVLSKLRVYRLDLSGTGASTKKLRVLRVSLTGAAAATLSSDRVSYDPGETVTITPVNGTAPHTYSFPAGAPAGMAIDNGVLTFPAPATKDGVSVTVIYNGQAYLTVPISPAFVLVGPTDIPAIVWVEVP